MSLKRELSKDACLTIWTVVICLLGFCTMCINSFVMMGYQLQWAVDCMIFIIWGCYVRATIPFMKTKSLKALWISICLLCTVLNFGSRIFG